MSYNDNPSFIGDDGRFRQFSDIKQFNQPTKTNDVDKKEKESNEPGDRDLWSNNIEFLLSCIAMSVGLGNIWRFPFTALENGGGAFLIPYLIILFFVGKPFYYLEMIIGQFSSRGTIKVYNFCPAMRGAGVGQVISISLVSTYYASIMGLTLKYVISSFESILPWSVCDDSWTENCIPALEKNDSQGVYNIYNNSSKPVSSSELYFLKNVLHEVDNINDGIGLPNWQLVIALLVSWILIYIIIVRGVKSSGKAAYFLAIFPYIVLVLLFIKAVTLPGASTGMLYFIKPQWDKLLSPKVWYAAVTQVFFSLGVCFGMIIMYSSYNKFDHNIYRDSTIVTLMDTFTSLLAGFTIFGILGHLAHEIGTDDIESVVKSGAGLAFISYPDAIAKIEWVPQIFGVLFFTMLFTLGIGSNIAMVSCVVTAIRDYFPKIQIWSCALVTIIISFFIGLFYVTPGGQFILNLVDYFGASMISLILGIVELISISWIYGVDKICKDTEFMIGKNPGLYWRICWGIVTPLIMLTILIYTFISYEPLTYKDVNYPEWAYAIGWTLASIGIAQIPIWAIYAIIKQPGKTICDKIVGAFRPSEDWGPTNSAVFEKYKKMVHIRDNSIFNQTGFFANIKNKIFN